MTTGTFLYHGIWESKTQTKIHPFKVFDDYTSHATCLSKFQHNAEGGGVVCTGALLHRKIGE